MLLRPRSATLSPTGQRTRTIAALPWSEAAYFRVPGRQHFAAPRFTAISKAAQRPVVRLSSDHVFCWTSILHSMHARKLLSRGIAVRTTYSINLPQCRGTKLHRCTAPEPGHRYGNSRCPTDTVTTLADASSTVFRSRFYCNALGNAWRACRSLLIATVQASSDSKYAHPACCTERFRRIWLTPLWCHGTIATGSLRADQSCARHVTWMSGTTILKTRSDMAR